MKGWIKTSERLPESHSKDEPLAPYYTVQCNGYTKVQAMFLDNEWWTNYISKIMVPVDVWLDESD